MNARRIGEIATLLAFFMLVQNCNTALGLIQVMAFAVCVMMTIAATIK